MKPCKSGDRCTGDGLVPEARLLDGADYCSEACRQAFAQYRWREREKAKAELRETRRRCKSDRCGQCFLWSHNLDDLCWLCESLEQQAEADVVAIGTELQRASQEQGLDDGGAQVLAFMSEPGIAA